jgi:hypothetical protein
MWTEREKREITSFHEAGHCVVACAFGHFVREVEVVPPHARFRHRTDPCGWREAAIVAASGPAAEVRFCDMSLDDEVPLWVSAHAWRGDLRNILEFLIQAGDGAHPRALAVVRRRALQMVEAHWPAIERVAAALAERGRLTGPEAAALVGNWRGFAPSSAASAGVGAADFLIVRAGGAMA